MSNQKLLLEIIDQIAEAIIRIERRFIGIENYEDFLSDNQGLDKLDGIAMMLIWLGESLKNFEKCGGSSFLKAHSEIDWQGAKGMRNILSHNYGNLDPEIIFGVCQDRIPVMKSVILCIRAELEK